MLKRINPGPRLFVASIFTVLGASFLATTGVLASEFHADWLNLATFYSHLFLFFPSFGIVALCAFYVPACVFTDLYWHHVTFGRVRFAVGSLVLALASFAIAQQILSSPAPPIWQLHPSTLAADQGIPRQCRPAECLRLPVLQSVADVRAASERRIGLSPFVRDCKPDELLEQPRELQRKRRCFVTGTNTSGGECCASQELFSADLRRMYAEETNHSLTGRVHAAVLPLKVFFLLVVVIIGVMLAFWRRQVDRLYASFAKRIERGVLVGALAMLLWPASNHAFLQSASMLYGSTNDSPYSTMSPVFSIVFIGWALLLLLFFFRRHERDLEAAAKIGGAIASTVAVLKYNQIVDYSVRFVGSGADAREMAILGAVLAVLVIALVWSALTPEEAPPQPDVKPGATTPWVQPPPNRVELPADVPQPATTPRPERVE